MEYVGIAIAWLSAVLSNLKLSSEKPASRIPVLLILLATAGSLFSVYRVWDLGRRKSMVPQPPEARLFHEASGGTAIGDRAYIVDDEDPGLFVFVHGTEGYTFEKRIELQENGSGVTSKQVEDLEAVAKDPNNANSVYIVTSHSRNKKGEEKSPRWNLLEVSLLPGQEGHVLRKANLLPGLKGYIFDKHRLAEPHCMPKEDDRTQDVEVVMELEGLAIDGSRTVYLGFRAPLTKNGNALVLTAQLEQLFKSNPVAPDVFQHRELTLKINGKNYGIVSMEYDNRRDLAHGDIVILANSPNSHEIFPPAVFRWEPFKTMQSKPSARQLPPLANPVWGKPEVLLLHPKQDLVSTFFDGDKGMGGQVVYSRAEAGLN